MRPDTSSTKGGICVCLREPPPADKIVKANQSPPEIRIFGNAMTTERRMDTERCSPGHESEALL